MGWEPIVYTAENPEYPVIDRSFEKDIPENLTVLKLPIWEPYSWYKRVIGQKQGERVVSGVLQEKKRSGIMQKLSLWIRGNVFIPDARKFWIKPSARYLTMYLKQNPVDAIVSNGPPHSMHLIALKIKKATNLPWLADFRDPWSNIDFAEELRMSQWAKQKNQELERKVLQSADAITVVGDWMKMEFEAHTTKPIHVITNGFDPSDFENVVNVKPDQELFYIVHTGSLNQHRNQPVLWKAISELCAENPNFKQQLRIRLIGKNDVSVNECLDKVGLSSLVESVEYLPHSEITVEQKKAHVLLLSINNYGKSDNSMLSPKATLTGKVFEYIATGRPILMIGPEDGQLAHILRSISPLHKVVDFDAKEKCKAAVFELFNSKMTSIETQSNQFSRVELTRKMAEVLNSITSFDK